MEKNEADRYFDGLSGEDKKVADIFDEKKPTEQVAPISQDEAGQDGPKNRRHRRLEEALQRERESNIALNARIQALSEVNSFTSEESQSEIPAEWLALYGDTPEAQKAWKIQERLFRQSADRVREEVVQQIEEREVEVQNATREFESFIDQQLESLEDQYNVDLTSDSPKAGKARREFLKMVQDLSPKDDDGTITGYADFGSTFEVYQRMASNQDRNDPTANRQKELASRSMQRSGSGSVAQTQTTPGFRGWMKDYNLN